MEADDKCGLERKNVNFNRRREENMGVKKCAQFYRRNFHAQGCDGGMQKWLKWLYNEISRGYTMIMMIGEVIVKTYSVENIVVCLFGTGWWWQTDDIWVR